MRRGCAALTTIALGALYLLLLLFDIQLTDTYGHWLPRSLDSSLLVASNDYEDPILSILNISEPFTNSTYELFTSGLSLLMSLSLICIVVLAANNTLRFNPPPLHNNFCPMEPPNLVGRISVRLNAPSFDAISALYSQLSAGGHSAPADCRARSRVAIIVPYRDRDAHLRIFVHNLHAFLQQQQLDYSIFIIEQIANQTFNRAKLMNVGFVEANRLYNWQCYIFHDVDLLVRALLVASVTLHRHYSLLMIATSTTALLNRGT